MSEADVPPQSVMLAADCISLALAFSWGSSGSPGAKTHTLAIVLSTAEPATDAILLPSYARLMFEQGVMLLASGQRLAKRILGRSGNVMSSNGIHIWKIKFTVTPGAHSMSTGSSKDDH